jgi:hypothetical protein
MFAIEGGTKEKLEEIPLHWATAATTTADSKRIYAAINSCKLQLASTDATATTYNLTIKYKRILTKHFLESFIYIKSIFF